jgi:hypothetical protein
MLQCHQSLTLVMRSTRHSATAVGHVIYVLLGAETADRLLAFNTRTGLWHRPQTTGPSPLAGAEEEHHTCCAVGHRLFVFGLAGDASPTHFSSLHVLDTRAPPPCHFLGSYYFI